jgi:glycosyltransferase involved in cell wall biosynthesis
MDKSTSWIPEMPISVIVPFYNAQETLQGCLSALARSATESTEIILVNNNSKDRSFTICEDFRQSHRHIRILLFEEATKGPSAARNAGASIARGDWLIFTDADCIPSRTWISDYLVHFSEARLGAVAGCIEPYPPSNLIQKAISLFTLPPITKETIYSESNLTEGFYPTANLAVKKEIFDLIGGFNESLRYGEDHELCHKIYQAGYRIKAIETAKVQHIHRSTLSGLLNQAFGFGSSHPFELRYLTPGKTIFSSPFLEINKSTPGKWIWVDLNQADKKLLLSLIPGLFWSPLYFILIVYFFYLCFFIHKVGTQRNVITNARELPTLSLLLLLKSFALGAGRFVHSFKHKVLCV